MMKLGESHPSDTVTGGAKPENRRGETRARVLP